MTDRYQDFHRRRRLFGRSLALAALTALLTGCVSPYYSAFPPPVYAPPPSYATRPDFDAPLPDPVPLHREAQPRLEPQIEQAPQPRLEAAPLPEPSTSLAEPTPEPETALQTGHSPAPPTATAPAVQAAPNYDAPLQGFRPMRGQTKPGI